MITTNDEKKNVLHIACKMGSYKLLKYLLDMAGPNNLNLLKHIINAEDEMGLTPLFLLCQKGYSGKLIKNHKPLSHRERYKMINMLVSGYDPKVFVSFSMK